MDTVQPVDVLITTPKIKGRISQPVHDQVNSMRKAMIGSIRKLADTSNVSASQLSPIQNPGAEPENVAHSVKRQKREKSPNQSADKSIEIPPGAERQVIKELDMVQVAQGNDCIACEG